MSNFKEISFPRTRITTFDVFELGRKKHHITALLELDVTEARRRIREYRAADRRKLSFTAWLVGTIGKTLEEFGHAHAYLKGKRRLLVFGDVDISITVERVYEGKPVPLPYVIKQANRKHPEKITEEIDAARRQPVSKDDIVLGEKKDSFSMTLYYFLPGFLRRCIWRYILGRPKLAQRLMGSAVLTAVGMYGKVNGWFIHTSVHPISFGLSSVVKKPRVIRDSIEIREVLNMTVLIDHDVIDGAPMARFISALSRRIENGAGLQHV